MGTTQVSVVMPVHNGGSYLAEAMHSVCKQTFENWELLIVDDGSTDNTAAIAQDFERTETRCKYMRIPHVGLPAHVRNAGIREAQGEFVAFLDADDAWAPEKLARQLEVFATAPGIALVYTNGFVVEGGRRTEHALYDSARARACEKYVRLLWYDQIPTSSVLVRKAVLDEVGYFKETTRLRGVEDYDLWLRICARYQLQYVDQPLILYRRHPGGVSADLARGARNTLAMRWMHVAESGVFLPVLLGAQLKECLRIIYYSMRPGRKGTEL